MINDQKPIDLLCVYGRTNDFDLVGGYETILAKAAAANPKAAADKRIQAMAAIFGDHLKKAKEQRARGK
jgi:hypothetical protein